MKDKYGKNCEQSPLCCFRSGSMGRKCLWMRPQLRLVNLSLNPSQFKEVSWVLSRKFYKKGTQHHTSAFFLFYHCLSCLPFVCVRILLFFFRWCFSKVKSQMRIQQLEAVDTHSDDFSCVWLCSPLKVWPLLQTCTNRNIWTPPKKKIKNFIWYSLFGVSVMIRSRVPCAVPRPERQYCCY